MKEVRPFAGIVTMECSSQLKEQRRLSIQNNAVVRSECVKRSSFRSRSLSCPQSPSNHGQQQPVAGGRPMEGMERRLAWMGRVHSYRTSRIRASPRRAGALHRVQSLHQQTTILSQRHTEQAATKSKGNAAYAAMEAATQARDWQEEATRKPRPSTTMPFSVRSRKP